MFGKFENYTVTKITEWFWDFQVKYELCCYAGTETNSCIVLQNRTGLSEIKTTTENTPKPSSVVRPPIDLNITWFIHHLNFPGALSSFFIDRNASKCFTPRRNPDVDNALIFYLLFMILPQNFILISLILFFLFNLIMVLIFLSLMILVFLFLFYLFLVVLTKILFLQNKLLQKDNLKDMKQLFLFLI
jgi:hypothetical protein